MGWMGLVVIGHKYSNSTFGANKLNIPFQNKTKNHVVIYKEYNKNTNTKTITEKCRYFSFHGWSARQELLVLVNGTRGDILDK